MRLKEKLAQDLANDLDFNSVVFDQYLAQTLYLTGFHKARELIRKDVIRWLRETGLIAKEGTHYHELIGITLDAGEEEI